MKKIIITTFVLLLSATIIRAQDKKEKEIKIHLESSEDVKPVVYVDGKLFEFPIELLDADQIESVNVLKGEKAMKEYNAQHGVVLITTKLSDDKIVKLDLMAEVDGASDKNPMVIIDGKQSNREVFVKLSPEDIESVNVVKGEEAMKKYNATNGVIVVQTKKEKKN